MKPIRPKTQETIRHERATVLQQLSTPTAAQQRADIEANKRKAARLRRQAQKKTGSTS